MHKNGSKKTGYVKKLSHRETHFSVKKPASLDQRSRHINNRVQRLPEAVIYGLTQAFPAVSGSRFAACFFFCWPRMTT